MTRRCRDLFRRNVSIVSFEWLTTASIKIDKQLCVREGCGQPTGNDDHARIIPSNLDIDGVVAALPFFDNYVIGRSPEG